RPQNGGRGGGRVAQALRAAERPRRGHARILVVGGGPPRAHRARRLRQFHSVSALAHDSRAGCTMAPRIRCGALPRSRGRDREGACNLFPVTPSPPLPRTRGRGQTEFVAHADSLHTNAANPIASDRYVWRNRNTQHPNVRRGSCLKPNLNRLPTNNSNKSIAYVIAKAMK